MVPSTWTKISSNICHRAQGMKATWMMVMVQIVLGGVSIFYKLAANDGMVLSILIQYRLLFASAVILPLALIIERRKRPKLTGMILLQAFFSALFGGSLAQNLFATSIVLTSATFASAFGNLGPALTFIIAIFFRLERLELGTVAGKAKVLGTLTGIGGAMLLTFYKGVEIKIWSTHFNLLHHGQSKDEIMPSNNHVLGSILALGASISIALGLIFLAKMSARYPCAYSSTALVNVMGWIQAFVYALCTERRLEEWKLRWDIRLLTVVYNGILASGLTATLVMTCIRMRGPLFVSIFNPLGLVVVAIIGSLALDERLHLGSILGSVIIIAGLYIVIWGKSKEIEKLSKLVPSMSLRDVLENKKDGDSSATGATSMLVNGDGAPAFLSTVREADELAVRSGNEEHEGKEIAEEHNQEMVENGGTGRIDLKVQKI